jgi:hypothetical protein
VGIRGKTAAKVSILRFAEFNASSASLHSGEIEQEKRVSTSFRV